MIMLPMIMLPSCTSQWVSSLVEEDICGNLLLTEYSGSFLLDSQAARAVG